MGLGWRFTASGDKSLHTDGLPLPSSRRPESQAWSPVSPASLTAAWAATALTLCLQCRHLLLSLDSTSFQSTHVYTHTNDMT